MDSEHLGHCLQFNDKALVDEQVESLAEVNLDLPICEGELYLGRDFEPAVSQLVREASVICAFEQAGSQYRMDLDCRIHHLSADSLIVTVIAPLFRVLRDLRGQLSC